MSENPTTRRERATEDPWTVCLRVVHDARRDGIRVHYSDERLPAAVLHAAALLEALGISAGVPDDPEADQ